MSQTPIKLDKEQRKAVYAPVDRSLIVIAPPGCGKTLIMAKRIEYLVRTGAVRPPFKALGLTFTNAAANEMEDRIEKEIPEAKPLVYITNFHSFAYSVLRAYGNKIGIPRKFTVLGEIEKQDRLLTVLSKYEQSIKEILELPPEERWEALEKNDKWQRYKEWNREQVLKCNDSYEDGEKDGLFEKTLDEFRGLMHSQSVLDFDHILYYAYRLMKSHESVLDYYRAAFRYVLVDEFQDTNYLQFRILSLLTSDRGAFSKYSPAKVFILADPDQAIYEFQGATPENIDKAKELFSCEEVPLYKDYRFTSEGIKVLKTAISYFIRHRQTPSHLGEIPGDKPSFIAFNNMEKEADFIAREVKRIYEKGVPPHEIGILAFPQYRLKLVKQYLDQEGIDTIFVPDFRQGNIEKKYQKLFKELNNVAKRRTKGRNLLPVFDEICQKGFDIEDDEVLQILRKLAMGYDRSQFQRRPLWEKIQLFINEVLLEINWGKVLRERIKDKVFLSTIHGVKGLQFEAIIVCGLERYSFPNWRICDPCYRDLMKPDYLSRELIKNLKIFYVGISRAKEHLVLASSLTSRNGMYRPISCVLIPFADFLLFEGAGNNFCPYSKLVAVKADSPALAQDF